MTKAYLTKISLVSSLGSSVETFWKSLILGSSGAQPIDSVDGLGAQTPPVRYVHAVRLNDIPMPRRGQNQFYSENRSVLDHLLRDLFSSSRSATNHFDGVFWGNGQIGLMPYSTADRPDLTEAFDAARWSETISDSIFETTGRRLHRSRIAGHANTCNTGITTLGAAAQRIQLGLWRRALVVVQEIRLRDWVLRPYYKMNLLATSGDSPKLAMRPFAENRDGFVKGEGGCAFIVESEAAASESGRQPIAEVRGYSLRSEHRGVFEPGGDLKRSSDAVRQALAASSVSPDDIDYIGLYGSASRKSDDLEQGILEHIFHRRLTKIPAGSLKTHFGHLNSAASAMEIAATALMIKNQTIVTNLYAGPPEHGCPLFLPTGDAIGTPIRNALKMSFGFGWSNAAMVLSSC